MEPISKQEFINNHKDIFEKLPKEFQNIKYAQFYIEYDEFGDFISAKLKTDSDAIYYDAVNYDSNFNINEVDSGCWYRLSL